MKKFKETVWFILLLILLLFTSLLADKSESKHKPIAISLKGSASLSDPYQYSRIISILKNSYGIIVRNDSLIFSKDTNISGSSADSVYVTVTSDTLIIVDATKADTTWIYDDGDTTRIVSNNNPIKIGNNSLTVGIDGTVSIKTLQIPSATKNYVLTANDVNGNVVWAKTQIDSIFSSMVLDTLIIVDATKADTTWIYDDGDTTRIWSNNNPIKIGNNSLVVATDGKVSIKDMRMPTGATKNYVLTANDVNGNVVWNKTQIDSIFSSMVLDTLIIVDATKADTTWVYDDGDTTRIVSNNNPIKIGDGSLVVSKAGTVSINKLRIPTGAAANLIATSDATGNVSWENQDTVFTTVVADSFVMAG